MSRWIFGPRYYEGRYSSHVQQLGFVGRVSERSQWSTTLSKSKVVGRNKSRLYRSLRMVLIPPALAPSLKVLLLRYMSAANWVTGAFPRRDVRTSYIDATSRHCRPRNLHPKELYAPAETTSLNTPCTSHAYRVASSLRTTVHPPHSPFPWEQGSLRPLAAAHGGGGGK